jgi:hypothetical protein
VSQEGIWVGVILGGLLLVLIVRRMRENREEHGGEQVRYLIHSASQDTGATLGAGSGLQVTRYYFRQTDTATGPPDLAVFYDELFVDLVDPDSNQKFQNSMYVCTPRGLEQAMKDEGWDTVIGTELLIVKRYNLQSILDGALDHLAEIYEVRAQLAPNVSQRKPDLIG